MRSKRSTRVVLNLTIVVVGLVYALPLIWMLSTSLKPVEQTMSVPPTLLPTPVLDTPRYAVENYIGSVDAEGNPVTRGVWTDPVVDFPLFLRNSILVAILSVSGMVVSSAIVAYGFARVRWRGRGVVFGVLLATMMIPFPVLMGPLYVLFKELGWIGTFRPLWVPSWFAGAFNVFLLRQFYMTIPREIDEAARIDGCSHWSTFVHVILPLSRPALAVVALLQFIAVWNDFLGPLVFLQRQDQFTLALGLALYQSQGGNVPWNLLMAASVLVLSPVLIVFVITQRTFVEGIATQGLKE
ncbi:MAG: carbohydrate ABC transporter permease [Planctomycetota bacterium]|nr:MAG: carbohydrate ABC transporter permease [Planctomycetota bacterium]